ncbi:MAG: nucleoside-diphosphate kinase [bacterium]
MCRTLLIIKPDAYLRDLEKAILERVAAAGMRVVRSERRRLTRGEVEELYEEHRGKTFFEVNVDFLLSGEIGLFILVGDGDVAQGVRRLVGNKDPRLAESGTIRGDFGIDRRHAERTLVHASANAKEAEREIALLFDGQG